MAQDSQRRRRRRYSGPWENVVGGPSSVEHDFPYSGPWGNVGGGGGGGGQGGGGSGGGGGGGGGAAAGPGERTGPPGHGEVLIDAPDFSIYARLSEAFPTPVTPGGWGIVTRPNDTAITDYAGQEPRRETVGLMIDQFRENVGIELDLERLESLLYPVAPEKERKRKDSDRGDKGDKKKKDKPEKPKKRPRPPVFIVRGGVHLAGRRVVLETLDWGDSIRRPQDDKRVRQMVTLGLLEYEKPDRLKIKRKKRKVYMTKQGDTLKSIAKKLLGKGASPTEVRKYAEKIAKLNKLRDINRKLNKGKRLQLP